MKDFVHQRKNAVLKLVPPNVPLQIIMERLNLDFRQIKKLYDFRIKAFKIEEKFTKMAKRIVVHDLNTVSALLRQLKVNNTYYDIIFLFIGLGLLIKLIR